MKKLFWLIAFLTALVIGITVLGGVMAFIGLQQFDVVSELDVVDEGAVDVTDGEVELEEGDSAPPDEGTEALDLPSDEE
jgi:hypothetical protein